MDISIMCSSESHPVNKSLSGWILENQDSERAIRYQTFGGTVLPHGYIRSEFLREDLAAVLGRYYELTDEQRSIIESTRTKKTLDYDHDLAVHFTREQIAELYEQCPLWAELELRAYGDLLA